MAFDQISVKIETYEKMDALTFPLFPFSSEIYKLVINLDLYTLSEKKIGFIGNEDKNCNTIFQSQLLNIIDFLEVVSDVVIQLPMFYLLGFDVFEKNQTLKTCV